jgi:S1/P1 Nuclease
MYIGLPISRGGNMALSKCAATLLLAGASLSFSAAALAWSAPGHQAVGAIADKYIAGKRAAKEVAAILGPGMNLQKVSVWADCAKGVSKRQDGTFQYTVDPQFKECAPFETAKGQALMVDFVRHNWDQCKPGVGEEQCHKQYHYADVALERDAYKPGLIGASDHDVVHAIKAAVIVLKGGAAPKPFQISSKTEALMILAHYVGDIHQPLHVVAIYLDKNGKTVDPDKGTYDPATKTQGGNKIEDGSIALHKEWDTIEASLTASHVTQARVAAAKKVATTSGPEEDWSAAWATDTILAGKPAFKGLKFSKEDSKHQWQVTLPAGYSKMRTDTQSKQLIKAGARLGQLLEAIWP